MTLGPNAIMIKPSILSHYLYLYFISKNGQQTIKNIISGSAQPKFNKTDFRKLKVVIPKSEVIDKFNIIYQSIDDKITTNIQETQNLIALRDSLLPKLMKGEIAR
jgi:type I restriction enzyme S subunit